MIYLVAQLAISTVQYVYSMYLQYALYDVHSIILYSIV